MACDGERNSGFNCSHVCFFGAFYGQHFLQTFATLLRFRRSVSSGRSAGMTFVIRIQNNRRIIQHGQDPQGVRRTTTTTISKRFGNTGGPLFKMRRMQSEGLHDKNRAWKTALNTVSSTANASAVMRSATFAMKKRKAKVKDKGKRQT